MSDITSPLTSMDEREIVRMIRMQARDQSARRGWRCPSAEQVAAYLDQSLAGEDKARFEVHLASCDFCINLISSLVHQQETKEPIDVPAPLLRQAIATVPEGVPAARPGDATRYSRSGCGKSNAVGTSFQISVQIIRDARSP